MYYYWGLIENMIVKSFFKSFFREENPQVGLFRLALGIFFLLHYFSMMGDLSHYYGPGSMVDPGLMVYSNLSFLFSFWNDYFIGFSFYLLFFLFISFSLGVLPKWLLPLLFVFQLSFHNANPLIIHEPHQLGNLFLLFFFFLPLHSAPILKTKLIFQSNDKVYDHKLFILLIFFLGLYYFVVGVKKLPDPYWIKGEAINQILSFPYFKKDNWINSLLVKSTYLSSFLNYFSLVFEIGFIFLVFTRFRPVLIVLGFLFHLGIELTMDVGGFSQIMWVWYTCLLDKKTLSQIKNFIINTKRKNENSAIS
jgi:hypothetical protein